MGADWLKEGMQENDWVGVMMSALSVTAWETGSDVKKDEQLQIFLVALTHELHSYNQLISS